MVGARVTWKLNHIAHADAVTKQAAREGMVDALEAVLTEANKTVPLQTGDLERSGLTDFDPEQFRGTVSYGNGVATAYAIRQHEETGWHHAEGRRAKWLELTLREMIGQIKLYIAAKVKAALA